MTVTAMLNASPVLDCIHHGFKGKSFYCDYKVKNPGVKYDRLGIIELRSVL